MVTATSVHSGVVGDVLQELIEPFLLIELPQSRSHQIQRLAIHEAIDAADRKGHAVVSDTVLHAPCRTMRWCDQSMHR